MVAPALGPLLVGATPGLRHAASSETFLVARQTIKMTTTLEGYSTRMKQISNVVRQLEHIIDAYRASPASCAEYYSLALDFEIERRSLV